MKGQTATEFFLYLTVFIFVVIAAFLLINYMQNSEIPVQQNKVTQETGQGFADVISLAVRAGPGFAYTYYFPRKVYNYGYTINFLENGTLIEWGNEYGNFSYFYSVPPYHYDYRGCIADNNKKLISDDNTCKNILVLNNTLNGLIISQEKS